MQALATSVSDLEVERIIEKVLIRNRETHFDYTRKSHSRLTPSEHIWHYQLQEENLELRQKVKDIQRRLCRKEQRCSRQTALLRDIEQLKTQLEEVLSQNARLQHDLSRVRVKNNYNSSLLKNSFDDSLSRSKSRRECSCSDSKLQRQSPSKERKQQTSRPVTVVESPVKSILKSSRDVSINCQLGDNSSRQVELQRRREHIQALKSILNNQQRLIASYRKELSAKAEAEQGSVGRQQELDRKNTLPSTSRLWPIARPTSQTTFKPLSTAGSIVKIKRN